MHDHVSDVLSAGATNADRVFQEQSAATPTAEGGISCVLPQLHTATHPGVDTASLPLGESGVSPSNSTPAAAHSTRGESAVRPPPTTAPDPPAPDSGARGGATVPGSSSENPVPSSRATHGVSGSGSPFTSHEVDTGGSSVAADPEAVPAPGVHDAVRGAEVPAVLRPRTRLQAGIRQPKQFKDGTVRYGLLTTTGEPNNLDEALGNPNW